MKKILIAVLILLAVGSVQAQSWSSLYKEGNATYLGGYYAAVSYACLHTGYTNDTGSWASTPKGASIPYMKGCPRAIWDAMFNQVTLPVEG